MPRVVLCTRLLPLWFFFGHEKFIGNLMELPGAGQRGGLSFERGWRILKAEGGQKEKAHLMERAAFFSFF
jgi:hypothetical protein